MIVDEPRTHEPPARIEDACERGAVPLHLGRGTYGKNAIPAHGNSFRRRTSGVSRPDRRVRNDEIGFLGDSGNGEERDRRREI